VIKIYILQEERKFTRR